MAENGERKILLAHGGGGTLSAELFREVIAPRFGNPILNKMEDAATLETPEGRLAFTTDSFVVSPIFFSGGSIGDLAVCGTVNDLSMAGAVPLYLSLSLILEEGLPISDLEKILDAAKARAEEAGVSIVCGDTKVVPKRAADKIFINTAGIGRVAKETQISVRNATPGSQVLVSGAPGLHGISVMLSRGDFKFTSSLKSDVAPLNRPIQALLEKGVRLQVLRDPTRGGLVAALNDIAEQSGVSIELDEKKIPLTEAQQGASDILGLDPLISASEGCFVAVLPPEDVAKALEILKGFESTHAAALIGLVHPKGRVALECVTRFGARRALLPPRGEQMPRIC